MRSPRTFLSLIPRKGIDVPGTKALGSVSHAFSEAVVGSPLIVERGIEAFLERTQVDELMVTAAIYDHAARVRSFEIVADVRERVTTKMEATD